MNKKYATTVVCSLVFSSLAFQASAQQDTTAAQDKMLLRFVYERCPQADILRIDREQKDYLEIEYLCEGRMVEMGIRDNKVVFTERETDAVEVPVDRIKRVIEKRYPGGFLDEVSMLTVEDTSFLKAELIQDGLEHNMFFTIGGKIYKPSRPLASDKWSLDALKASGRKGPEGYDLLSPDTILELPPILREISGIAVRGTGALCVQDELGVVFEYDLMRGEITGMQRFTDVGDFEDITIQGDRILVLRSDGNIYSIGTDGKIQEMLVRLPTLNVEGIHYDEASDILLLASKEAGLTGPTTRRDIYKVDGEGTAELFLHLDVNELGRIFAVEHPDLASTTFTFEPSALAVHPITGALYVLSAGDRALAIHDHGTFTIFPLPGELFYKPEGIAFMPDGTMLISSEGDKKGFATPSILRFEYSR